MAGAAAGEGWPLELARAAAAVARAGLVDAFGHLSVRADPRTLLITPPLPLSWITQDTRPVALALDAPTLDDAAPGEAWLHVAFARARPGLGAACRAQPPALAALAALGVTPAALNGQAAMLGPVALYGDARLVRSAAAAEAVVAAAGSAEAVVLRGNGAVTLGGTLAEAVARMWLLERAAELHLAAAAAGSPRALPAAEQAWWRERAAELLPRVYRYLVGILERRM